MISCCLQIDISVFKGSEAFWPQLVTYIELKGKSEVSDQTNSAVGQLIQRAVETFCQQPNRKEVRRPIPKPLLLFISL